jgi:hypothetical protein
MIDVLTNVILRSKYMDQICQRKEIGTHALVN